MFKRKKPQAVYCNRALDGAERVSIWTMLIEGTMFLVSLTVIYALVCLAQALQGG